MSDHENDDPVPKPEGDYIQLEVCGINNTRLKFKVKRTMQMKKVKKMYAEKTGSDLAQLRFMFEQTRIQDDTTPKMLEMEDGDTIEVFSTQTGGFFSTQVL